MEQPNGTHTWRVAVIESPAPNVQHLYLAAEGSCPAFKAGQYLTVILPEVGPAEGKAYSISSAPHESMVRLTVRQIGAFSTALCSLRVGDRVTTSAPYGFFYPEPDEPGPLIFVAAGIGVTPFMSIIAHAVQSGDDRPISLFYSNQTEADIVFRSELSELEARHPALTVTHFVTRETPARDDVRVGRMTAADVYVDEEEAMYFLCGSMGFTKAFWRTLRSIGVPSHQLYTEGFF